MRLEYFEMIDEVVRLNRAAGRIEAIARVPMESPVFEGHFPGHPLVPGVLLTETMAQASGYLVLAHLDFAQMPFLMAVDKARFRSFVGPGALLEVTASLEHDGSGYAVTKAAIRHAGKALCDAELRFRTMPFPDGLDAPMRERAAKIGLALGGLVLSGRDVVVTGVGLVSCAGEGLDAHLDALEAGAPPRTDETTFAPYPVHPAPALSWDGQIPKKSDQRQMEAWQRLGVYAAGLALEAAGVKDDAAFKAGLHLVVACGGGERDYAVDGAILTGLRDAPDPGAYLNERLLNDLRPTLFLAQLSNLLAGNIAIVHGVTGASRTFMGEESAGVDALRIAHARIAAGQIDAMLVGGSYNAERPDVLVVHEMGGYLSKGAYRPVFERQGEGEAGFVLGSCAAFLVLESGEHAAARGAKALARIAAVESDRTRREPGSVSKSLAGLWKRAGVTAPGSVLSAATGVAPITAEERAALKDLAAGADLSALGDLAGHGLEVAAPLGAAIAAGLVARGKCSEVAVTTVGHRRGEGVVRVVA